MGRLFAIGLVASSAVAGTRIIQNDRFTGVGNVQSVGLGEYEGGGVLFRLQPADYPLVIVAIDVLVVPHLSAPAGAQGAYLIDLWNNFDGGSFIPQTGVRLTSSASTFNRYTLPQKRTIGSGDVFVGVTQQTMSSLDDTALALDQGPVRTGNWFFDGAGGWERVDFPDGGTLRGIRGNFIIRLVVEAPDAPVTVTSITPSIGRPSAPTPVRIDGLNFELGVKAFVGTTELPLRLFMPTFLEATVPAGLAPGLYDVRLRNPNGLEGTLPASFLVVQEDGGILAGGGTAGAGGGVAGSGGGVAIAGGNAGGMTAPIALSIDDVMPREVYVEDETRVIVTGNGFAPGATVLVGNVVLDALEVRSPAVISFTLGRKSLPVGTHDVTVVNLSGTRKTLAGALTARSGSAMKPSGCSCSANEFSFGVLAAAIFRHWPRRRRSR